MTQMETYHFVINLLENNIVVLILSFFSTYNLIIFSHKIFGMTKTLTIL